MRFSPQVGFSAARCQPIKVAGLTITNALRQSTQRASFENTNLSAGVVGRAFFSRSRNSANCLRKNRFSAARAKRRRPDITEQTQTVTDDLAQVPNELGKPAEDVKHRCNRLTANSLISCADRIIA
jgi:hypothetical protein